MLWILALFMPYLWAQQAAPASALTPEPPETPWSVAAPKQYIFADRSSSDFSERTSAAPFTEITPHPLVLTNSAFENIFFSNTSVQAKSQGSPAVSIRGSSQAARVVFILDDVPLNFADGFGGSQLLIPLEITQKIHLMEGPASTLYGANAMGGALHFKTRSHTSPLLRLGLGDAVGSVSPLTTTNGAAILPHQFNSNHSLQASAFAEKDRGDFNYTTPTGDSSRTHNSQHLRRFTLGTQHQFEQWKLKTFSLYTGLNKKTPGPINTPVLTDQKSDVVFSGLTALYTSASYSARTTATFSRLHSGFIDSFGINFSNSEKFFLSEIISYKLSDDLSAQTIVDINLNHYNSSYTGTETFERWEPEVAHALTYNITEHLTVEPSLRYLLRYQKMIHQLNIPYRLEHTRWWLSASEGFRPPSLTDLYAQTPYFVGNTQLLPERSYQVEAGGAWDTSVGSVSATVFKTKYRELFRSSSLAPGILSKINVGHASSQGLNLGVTAQPHPRWLLKANHSLMSTQDETLKQDLPFSPKNQSFAAVSYNRSQWTWTLQHSVWSSFLDTDFNTGNLVKLPRWDGTDVFVGYQGHAKTSINFGLFNVFDNPRQLSFDFPEPQRRFFLNIEVQL